MDYSKEIKNIVYITAIYNVHNYRSNESVFADFAPFLKSSFSIVLFTDETNIPPEILTNPSIQVIVLPRTEIKSFQFSDETILPSQRNPEKDNREFLGLMNAKPEFVKRASELVSADAYVWFDAGILKISRHRDRFVERMGKFYESHKLHPNQIIIPGCIPREKINFSQMFSFPIWRFCGGLFIVPYAHAQNFCDIHREQLEKCKTLNSLTWEVNLFAAMERDHPDLFRWYAADHNDSIVSVPLPKKEKRVILLSMIKNENKIIKRLIESTLSIADAVCICDTGSTDNTIEVLTDYFSDFKIPTRIFNGEEHLWKNFGYNRSQSFLAAVQMCKDLGWDLDSTYALAMDADMQLVVLPPFSKESLTTIGYKIIQKSHSLEYYNARFLCLGHPWKCTGVTHEYWDGGETDTITADKIYISDIGDGGCKSDKFERDVRLLEEGLRESPNNPRYLFYLAQSYKDSGVPNKIEKSIEYYQKRVEVGGWVEETWYAMYMLMKLYAEKKDYPMMEMWGQKAYELRKERSENLLYLCRHFKDRRQYLKAWHYYQLGCDIPKPNDLLFVETDAYGRAFEYEKCIIHDYVFPHKKIDSCKITIDYANKYNDMSLYGNLRWFVEKIPSKVRKLHFQDIGDYVATSTSMLKLPDGFYRLNVRYVNYRIQPDGSYLMMDDGNLSGGNPVRTENYTCLMDADFNIISALKKMNVKDHPRHHAHIKGLEDVRIFSDSDGKLKCFGTSIEHSHDGKIRQIMADYNPDSGTIENTVSMTPPHPTDCEKNWIPYKDDKIIYSWHPFQIGSVDKDNKLCIDSVQQTPKFLSNMRGSSTLVKDGDYYYGITHCVIYQQPRKYYHMVVKIDARTDKLVGYTVPFFFLNNAIEYVLGFEKCGESYKVIVSQNDRNPVMIDFEDKDVHWYTI
jgi:glycosyltransferase involved in cell wall biosynthesis